MIKKQRIPTHLILLDHYVKIYQFSFRFMCIELCGALSFKSIFLYISKKNCMEVPPKVVKFNQTTRVWKQQDSWLPSVFVSIGPLSSRIREYFRFTYVWMYGLTLPCFIRSGSQKSCRHSCSTSSKEIALTFYIVGSEVFESFEYFSSNYNACLKM